jgi:hypothetical protein
LTTQDARKHDDASSPDMRHAAPGIAQLEQSKPLQQLPHFLQCCHLQFEIKHSANRKSTIKKLRIWLMRMLLRNMWADFSHHSAKIPATAII